MLERFFRMDVLALIAAVLFLAFYLAFQLHSVRVVGYTVPLKGLPPAFDGFTILLLSDLHSKKFGENQKRLRGIIQGLDYDMAALTGDFVSKDRPAGPVLDLLDSLHQPVFYVTGNHDWRTGFRIRQLLQSRGVQLLENRAVKLARGEEHIWIVGVDDPYLGKDDLEGAVGAVDDSAPRILLAHAPNIFQEAADLNIDLVLVGHTHGGQVRLPIWGAVIVPGQGFFPKLDYGRYSTGSTTLIITSGLGESGLPIRFNCRPEVVLVTLQKAN